MNKYTKEYLKQICEAIKSYGMRVFVRKDSTYGYFSDGKGVGYFQLEYNGSAGFSISTVNANGGGYRVVSNASIDEVTEEKLKEAFQVYPNWVHSDIDRVPVIKYKDLDDFLRKYWDKDRLVEYSEDRSEVFVQEEASSK